jgi:MSHA biogenesis protein MshP
MCPKKSGVGRQQGSSLVMALFIIVVVSLLGAALMKMLSTSGKTIAYQVIGIRAFAAANTGAEVQLKALFPLGSSSTAQTCTSTDGVTGDIYGQIGGDTSTSLANCTITVTCADFEHDGVSYYHIESTGTCPLDNGKQTSRTVAVEARSL